MEQALEMYTVHAARAGGLEQEVGTLEAGKRADLVVLNHDPTAMKPHELERLAVVRTVCGGADFPIQTSLSNQKSPRPALVGQ